MLRVTLRTAIVLALGLASTSLARAQGQPVAPTEEKPPVGDDAPAAPPETADESEAAPATDEKKPDPPAEEPPPAEEEAPSAEDGPTPDEEADARRAELARDSLSHVALEPGPPPRPEHPDLPDSDGLPWHRRIEIGGELAFISRHASTTKDGEETGINYEPAVGFGFHARWAIFDHLQVVAYFVDAHHTVSLPPGALGLPGDHDLPRVAVYSFGARLSPTWPWADWARSWLTGGIGWGRYEFDRMQVKETGKPSYEIRERSSTFVEVPLGVGTSFEIWPNWLAFTIEATAAPVFDPGGSAVEDAQAIDADGKKRNVGAFPESSAHLVQTLGLSLLL